MGYANSALGNVTVVTINGGLLEHAGINGIGGGQTVYMTAGEIRSNLGVPSTNSGSFRFAAQGPDPAIYTLASASTSLISGRVAFDTTGKFGVDDGLAAIDLLVTATLTDGIGTGNPSGGLIKTNAGTMALNSVNTYSGTTKIDGGRLLVNSGSGSGTGTNEVDVAAGGTLGGTGLVGGTVVSYGSIAPGMSAGRLTIGKDCIVLGTLDIELGGTAAGSSYDQLVVSNTAAVSAGTLNVSLINGYMPATGDTFTIIAAGTVFGPFGAINPLPALAPATLGWKVDCLANTVVLSVTGAPPVATGFVGWAQAITNGLTNATDIAYGDGYPNLLKYATGSSPTNSDTLARMSGARTTNGLLALNFNRNTNATDVTLIVDGSNTATNDAVWNGIVTNINGVWGGTPNASVNETGTTNPVSVSVTDNTSTGTNRFLRLRVTRPQ